MCWEDIRIGRAAEVTGVGRTDQNGLPGVARPADPNRIGLIGGTNGTYALTFIGAGQIDSGGNLRDVVVIWNNPAHPALTIAELGRLITYPYYATVVTGVDPGQWSEISLPNVGPNGEGLRNWPGSQGG